VDQQLKKLMKELGEAINESLGESEQIAEVVTRIKEGGYDIFLVLEATIGVAKQGEKSSHSDSTPGTGSGLSLSENDHKFLKSLRIKIDEIV
jgi:hypothetical protein